MEKPKIEVINIDEEDIILTSVDEDSTPMIPFNG